MQAVHIPQLKESDDADHVPFRAYFHRHLRGIRITGEPLNSEEFNLLQIYDPGHYHVPLEAVAGMPDEQAANVRHNWRPAYNFDLSMAGELPDLLPVAPSTSHPDLDMVTGLPTTGSIFVATRSTAASTIEIRSFPSSITWRAYLCPDAATRFIPNFSNEELVEHINVDPHWLTWKKISIFQHELAGGAAACVDYLWSHWRSRTLWQLLAKDDAISYSFPFSSVPSDITSPSALRDICETASVDAGARFNSWMIAARPFCQAMGVRHVLLQTDDHTVFVLFNKDQTIVTFSHIEEFDMSNGHTTEDDDPIPHWAADSVSILRFPRTNVADMPPVARIVGRNFLRSPPDFRLKVIGAEIRDEISEAGGDMDEKAIQQEVEQTAGQVAEGAIPAAPQDLPHDPNVPSPPRAGGTGGDGSGKGRAHRLLSLVCCPAADEPGAVLYQTAHLHPNAEASGSRPAFEPTHSSAPSSYPPIMFQTDRTQKTTAATKADILLRRAPTAAFESFYKTRADGHQNRWDDGNAAYLSYDTQPLVHAASHYRDQIMTESICQWAALVPRSGSAPSSLSGWDGGMCGLQSTSGAYAVTANDDDGTSSKSGVYGGFDTDGTGYSGNDGPQRFSDDLIVSPTSAPYSSPLQHFAMCLASPASTMWSKPESYVGLLPGQNPWSMEAEEPMVDIGHPTVMPSFSYFDHEEARPMDGAFAEMVATTSSVVKENVPHAAGVKHKHPVTEGESESDTSPIAPIVAFDLQPRTPDCRPLIPSRFQSYYRNHGLVGRAPSLDTVDVDEEEVQKEERPAKRPRTSDVAPPISGATKAVATPVASTATIAQAPPRAQPSQTYEQLQLDCPTRSNGYHTKTRVTRASPLGSTDVSITRRSSRRNAMPGPTPGGAGSRGSATSTKLARAKAKARGKDGSHPSRY
ncbi:hypothetical protein FRB97_007853 [Tulasnella sp. 331]|nr:hypothetical protein FRB97_007853 [Tulasnella sp. 331]